MIQISEMKASVEQHLSEVLTLTDAQVAEEAGTHIKQILIHLERMHRALAVHLETLG